MNQDFTKVIRLGRVEDGDVFCKVEYIGGRLSIVGVIGPTQDGNARGSCGQINDSIKGYSEMKPAPGWTQETLDQFLLFWDRWHLNDMQAGTPEQMAWLEEHAEEFPGYPTSHYDWAKDSLREAGLNPHNGYKYGSSWLKVDVPDDVIEFLRGLPDTDKEPAWV